MADLKQMQVVLSKTSSDLEAYATVFNNTANSIIGNAEAMGISAVDLRNQINELVNTAQSINNLGKNLNLDDKSQVDNFISKIKELDGTFSDLSPVILANLKEINTALQREFKLDDGTTGYLKSQLNELRSLFEDDLFKIDVSNIAPDLAKWADSFVEQVNKIEYNMGKITEFGKGRTETEKALGFTVENRDISSIVENKKQELDEYNAKAISQGFKGINDSQFLESYPEAMSDIDSINRYIKQLDGYVGKKIKGYVDIFNEANNILKAGESYKPLYEAVSNPMFRESFGDNIDWNKMTPTGFKELENGFSDNSFSDNSFFEDTKSIDKTAESISKVDEASNKAISSIRNYNEELNKLVSTDNVLSNDKKQDILGKDFSDSLKKYTNDIDYFKGIIKSLGDTKLVDMPDTILDVNSSSGISSITNYKARIAEATNSLRFLEEEQKKLFTNLNDPTVVSKMAGTGFSSDLFNDIKSLLESGYKVNLIDGSADKEKLNELKTGFEQLISNFKNHSIDIVSDDDILDIARIDALQKAINDETKKQNAQAKAQENYEKNKLIYLEQYNKISQAQANIKALNTTKDYLLNNANSGNKKEISQRYSTEIINQEKIITQAKQVIDKYKAEFNRHKLQIPIEPIIKSNANLTGDFKKDYIGIKASGRNEVLAGLATNDANIDAFNKKAQELGINVDKINSRLAAIKTTIKTAFYSGDIEKAKSLLGAYSAEVDKLKNKVDGQSRAQEVSKERQRQAAEYANKLAQAQAKAEEDAAKRKKDALDAQLNAVKKYVSEQNALRASQGKAPMSGQDEANYYASQLNSFVSSKQRYIEVLKLKQAAERKAAEESKRLAQEQLNAFNTVLNTISGFANAINKAVNTVIMVLRGLLKVVNTVFNAIGKAVDIVKNSIQKFISLFGGFGNRVRGVGGDFNVFKNSATELRSKIQLLKGALNTLFNNQLINQSKKVLSSISTMSVILGKQLTDNTIAWAEAMQTAFGVDASNLIADMGEIMGVLHGLGMKTQDVATGSANLVLVSRYLGMMGMAGGDADQVMSKITSGMKGMTQAIDDLGLSVRDAEMNSFLTDLKKGSINLAGIEKANLANLKTDFSSLNEEARVYVRYAAIITQFLENFGTFDAFGNYIFNVQEFRKQLNSVTGRLSLLKDRWGGFTATLGKGFAKIAALIAGYLVPIIEILQSKVEKFFAWISKLTGMNFEVDNRADANSLEYDTSGTDKAKESTENLNKELEKVEENAKNAKGGLQSFDRVNNITTPSSDANVAGEDFDYSFLAEGFDYLLNPLENEYENFLDNLNNKNAEYAENLKRGFFNLVKELKMKAKEITGRSTFDLGFNFNTIGQDLATIFKNIKKVISSWGTFFIEIALKIADDMNIGKIITRLVDLFARITTAARVFSEVAIPVFRKFYDDYLKPVFEYLGKEAIKYLDKATKKVQEFITRFTQNPEGEANKLRKTLEDLFKVLKGDKEAETPLENVIALIRELKDVAVALAPIIGDLAKSFGSFVVNEALPWLVEKLDKIGKWLTENKDDILNLIKNVSKIAWLAFKKFVDIVGVLIDFTVKHPGVVVGFFAGLLALKVSSWALKTASSIGKLSSGLVSFIAMFKADGILAGIGATLGKMGISLSGIGTAIASALPYIALIIAAIVAVGAVIVDLWNTSETFRESITTIFENLKNTFVTAFEPVKEAFSGLKEKFIELYTTYSDSGLKDLLEVVLIYALQTIGLTLEILIEKFAGLLTIIFEVAARIIEIVSNLADTIIGVFDIIMGVFTGDWDRVYNGWNKGLNGLLGLVKNIVGAIGDIFSGLWNTVTGLFDNITNAVSNIRNTYSNRASTSVARRVTAHANGGSIAGGQLFIANENGNAELIGNIDGTSKTNVANNSMIIKAMTDGVFTGVYNALAEASNQRTSAPVGNANNVNLKIDGFGLIDQSTLSQLARLIAPHLNSNNSNIANVNFSI